MNYHPIMAEAKALDVVDVIAFLRRRVAETLDSGL
jgi:hypothetical protein